MSSDNLLLVTVVGTGVFVLFAAFFLWMIISNQRKIVTTQKEKLAESKRLEEVLRLIPNKIIQAQEEERGRVAKGLHDGIIQMLASIKYRLHVFKVNRPSEPQTFDQSVDNISNDLLKTMEEVRRISHNLRPKILDDSGFSAAVQSLCEEFLERTKIAIACNMNGDSHNLPKEVELGSYRILQEALNNIEKHAKATSVHVRISQDDAAWMMSIDDNGKGFNASEKNQPDLRNTGLGSTTMRERTALMGGTLEILSSPGHGTEIILKIPVKKLLPRLT